MTVILSVLMLVLVLVMWMENSLEILMGNKKEH